MDILALFIHNLTINNSQTRYSFQLIAFISLLIKISVRHYYYPAIFIIIILSDIEKNTYTVWKTILLFCVRHLSFYLFF